MGEPLWRSDYGMGEYRSKSGHEVRFLAIEGEADYEFGVGETARDIVERVGREWRPDLFLCWHPELYPPPRAIEECPIQTAAVISDWNIYHSQFEHNLSRYDVVCLDKLGERALDAPGAELAYVMPIYSQRSLVHRKIDDVEKDIDVLFAGNPNHAIHARRGRRLEQVASLSGEYRIVIGHGYLGEDYTRMLNRARIVFNHGVRHEMNLRCFEAIACGTLLFVEEENLEAGEYLRDREEVVLYGPGNLVELLRRYLDDPAELGRVAAAGYAAAQGLALENRLDGLFDWLAARSRGKRAFRRLSEAERTLADAMQYASSLIPAQCALAEEAVAAGLERFPDRAEFPAGAGCLCFGRLIRSSGQERKELTRLVLEHFTMARDLAPESAALLLNLALVCNLGHATDAERRFLDAASAAKSTVCGGMLLGSLDEPYYARWRQDLAFGEAAIEKLHADALARLARICLKERDYARALDLCEEAITLHPEIAVPYRLGAEAASGKGDYARAAALLERGLPFTAFDAGYRLDLVSVLKTLGRKADAAALATASARMFAACKGRETDVQSFRELP